MKGFASLSVLLFVMAALVAGIPSGTRNKKVSIMDVFDELNTMANELFTQNEKKALLEKSDDNTVMVISGFTSVVKINDNYPAKVESDAREETAAKIPTTTTTAAKIPTTTTTAAKISTTTTPAAKIPTTTTTTGSPSRRMCELITDVNCYRWTTRPETTTSSGSSPFWTDSTTQATTTENELPRGLVNSGFTKEEGSDSSESSTQATKTEDRYTPDPFIPIDYDYYDGADTMLGTMTEDRYRRDLIRSLREVNSDSSSESTAHATTESSRPEVIGCGGYDDYEDVDE